MSTTPSASRARLPDGYGLPADSRVLAWREVDARIAEAHHYWMCTVSPAAEPVPRPIDGMWLDATLYVGGDPASRWWCNLHGNPAAAVALPDPERAVILHGRFSVTTPGPDLAGRLAAAANAKYGSELEVGDVEGQQTGVFSPSLVLAWTTLYEDASRFVFPG